MIMDQLTELTSKGCGCLLIVDEMLHLIGTFTDGDLRRTLKSSGAAIFNLTVGEMCNSCLHKNCMLLDLLIFVLHDTKMETNLIQFFLPNRNPRTISPDAMAVEAMQKMESPPSAVQFLPVVDYHNLVIGIITLHGLVTAGL
ncbi:hypothetical protein B296_00013416 [Ensete ventricosum]|uniref:CBS domain-containing protein n=1 Tax=Ensete ventricosum TaxID=4639 RepID=A0A427AL80_ENSVE|nr:hypothetical protein B296_00013416 [Ensete ventricosum]